MKIINGVRYTDEDAKLLGIDDGIETAPAPEALAGALHAARVAPVEPEPTTEPGGDEPEDDSGIEPTTEKGDGDEPELQAEDEQPPVDESIPSADGEANAEEGTDGAGEPERPRAARRRTK